VFTRSVHPEISIVQGASAVPADFALIRAIPLFRYLGEAEVRKVLSVAKRRGFQAGDELITENSLGTETYVILRGSAQLVKGGLRIGVLEAGNCFGEMTMFENAPRSASVWAQEPGELLSLARPDLFPLLQRDPQLAVKLLWSVCQTLNGRLRKTTEDLTKARTG
jgi:CRP-like cAMP-binding protein